MLTMVYPKSTAVIMPKPELSLNNFGDYFDSVEVMVLEPTCPFCGKHLQNANCDCASFSAVSKSFLSKYNGEKLKIKLAGGSCVKIYSLKSDNIQEQAVPRTDFNVKFCETGTICKIGSSPQQDRFWMVSLGRLKINDLTFLIREFGKETIFEYRIKDVDLSDVLLQKVQLYVSEMKTVSGGSRRFGDYRMEHNDRVVAELTYDEFLHKLREILPV